MNQIDIKKGVLLTILACKSSQQFVLSLVSLEFSHLVFLLSVWGGVASSTFCCWVVRKYTEIPYIDSCPVPACHSPVLWYWPAWFSQRSAPEKRAGQPALVSSSAVWPRREMPFGQKCFIRSSCARTMTSDPDLEAKTRFSPRSILDDSFLGEGVALWRGGGGFLPRLPWREGGGGRGEGG